MELPKKGPRAIVFLPNFSITIQQHIKKLGDRYIFSMIFTFYLRHLNILRKKKSLISNGLN
jgi:hypothetical protein